ncbi:hypothetical protein [Humibacter albus]|uniref:hypothetical protein n=1 Tax=Humibacter albus TaxID=427754 RepID=UPI000408DB44|nr:hypothetical protein [Humibacter albus]
MSTAAPVRRPGAVTAAYVIWLIGAIISLLGAIFALVIGIFALTIGAVAAGLGGAAAGAIILTLAIFVFIIAIIELIIVSRMRAGRNWARVVLTILGALSIASTIVQWAQNTSNAGTGVGSAISVAIVLLAIILMYVPTANAYFAAGRR